jgi:hypothetical protein
MGADLSIRAFGKNEKMNGFGTRAAAWWSGGWSPETKEDLP